MPTLNPSQLARPTGISPEALLAQVEALQIDLNRIRDLADARRSRVEEVNRELHLAARLQRDFLPKKLPNAGRVRFGVLYRPAGHVSGDTYDVRRLDERHVGVYLADAVGHGLPAALLAMFLHNALSTKRIHEDGTYRLLGSAEAMAELNERLCDQNLSDCTFATAAYARVDVTSGEVDLARGGHPLGLLLRRGAGEIEEVGGDGPLLGVMRGEDYGSARVVLEPGDRLVLYTDGVEMIYVGPDKAASLAAWREAVQARHHLSADDLLEDVRREMDARGPLADDVTVVTLEMS